MRACALLLAGTLAVAAFSCAGPESGGGRLSGSIVIDGSGTVFPLSEAVAEGFRGREPKVDVVVGSSGTGAGFQKFCNGETAIQDASRPITASEMETCRSRGIDFVELPVALDALTVVVHPSNRWLECITVAQLKKMWEPAAEGVVTRWNQVDPSWPERPLHLYGPTTAHGSFDYFTEAVVGRARASRGDYSASADYNVIVASVSADGDGLGYMGLAYYQQNASRLKALAVDGGQGCVQPAPEKVIDGSYPLSRPLFIYVSSRAMGRPDLRAFVDYYLETAKGLAAEVGYIPLSDEAYELVRGRWQEGRTGSAFAGSRPGTSVVDVLRGAS